MTNATAAQRKAVSAKTVLIADDNPLIRGLLRELFLSDGFVCVEAGTGHEAIETARRCKPSLIILDVAMPVMSGLDATPVLRAFLPKTPIILFTLFGDHLKKLDLTSLGISATFAKSDPLDKLIHMAHELTTGRANGV
jgi:CheY-like chemotaxis protein